MELNRIPIPLNGNVNGTVIPNTQLGILFRIPLEGKGGFTSDKSLPLPLDLMGFNLQMQYSTGGFYLWFLETDQSLHRNRPFFHRNN
jgi:hypothetical protein